MHNCAADAAGGTSNQSGLSLKRILHSSFLKMCVWRLSLPSWRNIDGDCCKRAETHTDDLKSNEVAHSFHKLCPLESAAIHADEAKFLSQLLHNGLCLRVVRAEKDRDPPPHQFIAIEFNDLSAVIAVDDDLTRERLRFFERARRK